MKLIVPLIALFIANGCASTRKGSCCASAHTAATRAQPAARTVPEKVGDGLFWLGQSALYTAANNTAQTESPFPK